MQEHTGSIDECLVCHTALQDVAQTFTQEHIDELLVFCSKKCMDMFVKDPEMYRELNGEEEELE